MANTILKFEYSGSTVSFNDLEINTISMHEKQPYILQKLQNRAPRIIFTGEKKRSFTVFIYPKESATVTNAKTLKSVDEIMTMKIYYQSGTIAEAYAVHVDPSGVLIPHNKGAVDTGRLIELYFMEASEGIITAHQPIKTLGVS